jgi:hypothetical protein
MTKKCLYAYCSAYLVLAVNTALHLPAYNVIAVSTYVALAIFGYMLHSHN